MFILGSVEVIDTVMKVYYRPLSDYRLWVVLSWYDDETDLVAAVMGGFKSFPKVNSAKVE